MKWHKHMNKFITRQGSEMIQMKKICETTRAKKQIVMILIFREMERNICGSLEPRPAKRWNEMENQ